MKPELVELLGRHPAFQSLGALAADPEAFLRYMDAEGIWQAWIITYNAPKTMGYGRAEAEAVWDFCATNAERLVSVGGFDPTTEGDGAAAVDSMRQGGVRALKIHPVHQGISADDPSLDSFYARAETLRMPVLVHTGPSVFPGARNEFSDPSVLARVASAHPKLPLVIAHGGRPDQTDAALAVLAAHPNTWLDLSGCPPSRLGDYFGDLRAISERVLWGSDWPGPRVPGLAANVEAFLELGLGAEAEARILHDNAVRLLSG